MIFPFLLGFPGFLKAPVTWVIIGIQVFFFISYTKSAKLEVKELVGSRAFLETQGRVYSNFVLQKSYGYDKKQLQLAQKANQFLDSTDLIVMGQMALQDPQFSSDVEKPLTLDKVIFNWWQDRFTQLRKKQISHPHYILGVNSAEFNFGQWLSYQFVHSDFMHLFTNMVFFLIFGAALESMIGGIGLLVTFILGGLFSAGFFLLSEGASAVPLIGASGSVSAVIGLLCALNWRTGLRYLFFLFIPKQGYAGFIYLPGWIAFLSYLLADAAGFLSSGLHSAGVAYSAHLGGQGMGLLVAIIFFFTRKFVVNQKLPKLPPEATAKAYTVVN